METTTAVATEKKYYIRIRSSYGVNNDTEVRDVSFSSKDKAIRFVYHLAHENEHLDIKMALGNEWVLDYISAPEDLWNDEKINKEYLELADDVPHGFFDEKFGELVAVVILRLRNEIVFPEAPVFEEYLKEE